MRTLFLTVATACTLLLGGCASTVRSDVTTFHQWPAQLPDKHYVIETPIAQENSLELQSYQNLVRAQLAKLGFEEASNGVHPALVVTTQFATLSEQPRVYYGAWGMGGFGPRASLFYSPRYRSRYGFRGRRSPFFDPFFDDFDTPVIEERYDRSVKITIRSASDNRPLFDVTVHNVSDEMSTPALMPALVQSAFEGFPGPNGGARRIELKQEKGSSTPVARTIGAKTVPPGPAETRAQ
jgi:hypothetical protein